jgi:hypothetical protein
MIGVFSAHDNIVQHLSCSGSVWARRRLGPRAVALS